MDGDKNLEELKKENKQFKKYKGKNKNESKNYISQEEIKQKDGAMVKKEEDLIISLLMKVGKDMV